MEHISNQLALFKMLLTVGAVAAVALGGWNALIQSKLSSLSKLWAKWDEFQKVYAKDRLTDSKEYASRGELTQAVNKLDSDMRDMERRIGDKVGEMKNDLQLDIASLVSKVEKAMENRQ